MNTNHSIIPEIIYEDNHILVVNKKSNTLTQGDYSKKKSLLEITKEYIKERYNKPGNVYLGLVHRLDKPVSGVLIFAKTSKAAKRLSEQFKQKKIDKFYIALTENNKTNQNINQWTFLKNDIIRKRDISIVTEKNTTRSQAAELKYKTVISSEKFSLQLIKLLSGKKHQIRAQFSYLHNPILGDTKYDSRIIYKDNSIALHAYAINIFHPTLKKNFKFIAEIPDIMKNLLKKEFNYTEVLKYINHEIDSMIL